MEVPSVMRAWQYSTSGKPVDVLRLVEDCPVPTPAPDQLLVKVYASALNRMDKAMEIFPSFVTKKPAIPEIDYSGVVVDVGSAVKNFKIGDEVYGGEPDAVFRGNGTLCEYTVVAAKNAMLKPENTTWEEAATYPACGCTAWQGVVEIGNVKKGDRVFVNGGSGGLGSITIQVLKALGAYVVTTCSEKNFDFVKDIGADEVIDYRAVDVPTELCKRYSVGSSKFDVIMDVAGNLEIFYKCEPYLQPSGIYLMMGSFAGLDSRWGLVTLLGQILYNTLVPPILGGVNRRFKFYSSGTTKSRMEGIDNLIRQGKIRPTIDTAYSFDDALSAYEKIGTNRVRGKLVVTVTARQ